MADMSCVSVVRGAVRWMSGLVVDCDGAPRAYSPPGTPGLDYLANAGNQATWRCATCGRTGNALSAAKMGAAHLATWPSCSGKPDLVSPARWWALATDTGKPDGTPIVQGAHSPAPGCYVSMTALQDPTRLRSDPRRYVDATVCPYVSIPPEMKALGILCGDVGYVSYKGTSCGAIVADVGPHKRVGEGSMALAVKLGIPSSPRTGGASAGVTWVLFPKSDRGWPRPPSDIDAQARVLYAKWNLPVV